MKKVPVRSPDIVVRSETEEALMFNPADGGTVCINSTGKFIWDLCDGKATVGEIAQKVCDNFDVAREKAEKDCLEFLSDMEAKVFVGYRCDQ